MTGVPMLDRLSIVLSEVFDVAEDDEALTVSGEGIVASVRVVAIADGLEMVSLTQPLAWDLPLTNKLRERVAEHANKTMLGTVVLVEKLVEAPTNGSSTKTATKRAPAKRVADVMLRYNFPAGGLTDDALRTLILLVLSTGADIRRSFLA